MSSQQYFSVAEVADRFSVNTHKVLAWIASGDLAAVDVSHSHGKRPRWRIHLDAIQRFESARRSVPEPKPVRQTRRRQMAGVIEFVK